MITENDLTTNKEDFLRNAKFLHAYLECSDVIQAGIRTMLSIIFDKETDADDRQMAIHTLADALFPNPHEGQLGMDLAESEQMGASYSQETKQVIEEMDREENQFAINLQSYMKEKGFTQSSLAEITGVGQPAISNMLNRQCRPQKRTILKIANALEVSPSSLWPGFTHQ